MLLQLRVNNLALIDEAEINFSTGLNVLTGETGAGKSMVLGAVRLLLGGRATSDLVRKNAESCLVEGVFTLEDNAEVCAMLAEADIDFDDEIVMRRKILAEGKNTCQINLTRVPLAFFREVSSKLINIHGQQEQLTILNPDNQRTLLDKFAGIVDLQSEVATAYNDYKVAYKKLVELEKYENDFEEKLEFYNFQLAEIEKANLQENEEEVLLEKRNILANADRLSRSRLSVLNDLSRGKSNVLELLDSAIAELRNLVNTDSSLSVELERLESAYYEIEDINSTISSLDERFTSNPQELERIENRLHLIKGLIKKYGGSYEALNLKVEQISEFIAQYENREELIAAAKGVVRGALAVFNEKAGLLTAKRQEEAEKLSVLITAELNQLQMKNATFKIDIIEEKPSSKGRDAVVFTFSPNLGSDFAPIERIASGGEISRIMLGIKVILADQDIVGTMIFDEIDSGLGGIALGSVAEKLLLVSRNKQCLCVTHGVIIAAYAHNHFHVEKIEKNDKTTTIITKLTGDARKYEIARMIAGENITEATLLQGEELIKRGIDLSCPQ